MCLLQTPHFKKHLAQPRIGLLECLIWDHWNHHPNKLCNSHGFASRQHSSRTCRLVFCGSSSDSRNARSSTCDACRMSCLLCHHMAGLIQNQKQIYQRQCVKIPKTISCNFGWTSERVPVNGPDDIPLHFRSAFHGSPHQEICDLLLGPCRNKLQTKWKQQHWVIHTQWVLWFLDICTSL